MAIILIIDDDHLMCETMTRMVRRLGHETLAAETLAEGLALAAAHECDVVFLDVRLPDGNGLDALPKIDALTCHPEVIIMTGFGDPNGAELAIKSGAWDYIEKSSSVKEITLSLERALQYRQQKTAVAQSRTVAALKRSQIIGNSPRLNACLDLVAQAAGSDVNVFITGETGTGKELFARAVHENSQRARGNFVVVDCTALPETLVESLLFGHEKGSFTGADKARDGLVRQAHCGTLFLDELGERPATVARECVLPAQVPRLLHRAVPAGERGAALPAVGGVRRHRCLRAPRRVHRADLEPAAGEDHRLGRGRLLQLLRPLVRLLSPQLRERPPREQREYP